MMTMLSAVMLLGLAYVMACRLSKMRPGVTHGYIAVQHGVLGFASFASAMLLAVRPDAALPVLAAGVVVFFWISRHRWPAAPEDTSKPGEFDSRPHHWA